MLLAFLQKVTPDFRDHRLETGLCKIIQTLADDLFPWKTQKPAGAGTGIPIPALIVRDQDGCGRMVYDRPKQQLEFFGTILREPAGGLRQRGHCALLLSPSIQEAGGLENTLLRVQQTVGSRECGGRSLVYHRGRQQTSCLTAFA